MSLSNVSWNTVKVRTCVHDMKNPNHTIVVSPHNFQPFCTVCKAAMVQGQPVSSVSISVPAAGSLGGQIQVSVPAAAAQGFSYQINAQGAGIFPVTTPNVQQQKQESPEDAFDRAMRGVG